jgi:glycine oxidase
LIAGASVEHVGFDRTIEDARISALATSAATILPHLSETVPTETWIGFRPGSDELHIGPWHSPRFHVAYGHFRNGILLAPATVRKIAAELSKFLLGTD